MLQFEMLRHLHRFVMRSFALRKSCAIRMCIVLPLFALALVRFTVAFAQSAEGTALDALIARQDYREALVALDRTAWTDADKLQWLQRHAEQGHVPVMYELSARLFSTNLNESLKWYTRGRLARTLDAAECAKPTDSLFWRIRLDDRARPVTSAAIANARRLSEAIDRALEWDEQRMKRPFAGWICGAAPENGEAGLLPQPRRDKERASTRETMAINAKAIADFYKAVDAGAAVKYRRLDSHIDVPDTLRDTAGWLDDRRLLFVGRKPNPIGSQSEGTQFPDLYLWDTDEDRITVVRTAHGIYDVCVDGAKVTFKYMRDRTDSLSWLASGTFPDFEERRVDTEEARHWFRRPDCERVPDHLANRDVRFLRSEDGYLVRDKEGIALHRPDGSIRRLDVGQEFLVLQGYAPFARAYLLLGGSRDRERRNLKDSGQAKPGDSTVLFWLKRDGDTAAVEIPYGEWQLASGERYRPSRAGILLSGGFSDNENETGYAGLYLFETGGLTRQLDTGPSRVLAVSPNGCMIAYANAATRTAALRAMTMKIVDVCSAK